MTFTSLTRVICALAYIMAALPSHAKDSTIILSPVMDKTQLQQHVTSALEFALANTEPGERALIIDGQTIQVIAEFTVPNKPIYAHHKAKLNANRVALAKLKHFSNHAIAVPENGVAGAIKLPQVLEYLGRYYPESQNSDILILGSPLYHDIHNTDWSMVGNKYAQDELFTSSAAQSLFSTQGKDILLQDARLHWFTIDDSWDNNSEYRYLITRMWTLFIEGHGASLSTFSSDWATVSRRAAAGASAVTHDYDTNAQLPPPPRLHVVAEGMSEAEFAALVAEDKASFSDAHLPIFERSLSTAPATDAILSQPARVEVGISWDCTTCDLDLHVRPHDEAQVLSFSNKESDEGVYHKDFTSSPATINGYESASFTQAVTPSEMLIAINWYSGEHDAVITGELRMSVGDQTFSLPFTFQPGKGNYGKGVRAALQVGRAENAQWLIIDPKDVLGVQ